MNDESGTKFSDTSGVAYVHAPQLPVQKIKKPNMWPCDTCKKLTRSHRFSDKTALCHGCFEQKTKEELDEFARKHTKDYTTRSSGSTEADSGSSSEAKEQEMPR